MLVADRAVVLAHSDGKKGLVIEYRLFFIGRRVFSERAWIEMGRRLG